MAKPDINGYVVQWERKKAEGTMDLILQASIALWKLRLLILRGNKPAIMTSGQEMSVLGLALRTFCTLDIGPELFGGEGENLPAGGTLTNFKIRFAILVKFTGK